MIYVPAGLLRDQIEFKPKVEIWAGSRPSWTSKPESLAESFDDNGTVERISTLLENLDQRTYDDTSTRRVCIYIITLSSFRWMLCPLSTRL